MSTAAKVLSPFFSVVVLGLGLGLSPCLGVQGLSAECPEPCCIGRTKSHQQLHCHCRVTHRPSYGPNYPRQKSLTHSLILNLIVKCSLPISMKNFVHSSRTLIQKWTTVETAQGTDVRHSAGNFVFLKCSSAALGHMSPLT